MIMECVQRVQIQVFIFKSPFFFNLFGENYREAIYHSWTPEVKGLSSHCLVPAGHARGHCPSRPGESLKSAKLVRPLFGLQIGLIDKWQTQSAGVFISQTRICWTLSLSDNLVIRLCQGCWKCKATLPHIMFTSASTISVSLMTAAPVHNLYFSQCVTLFPALQSSSPAVHQHLPWDRQNGDTDTHSETSHVVVFSPFFVTTKATKNSINAKKNLTEHGTAQDCVRGMCVCVPQMGGVQTPGANILNLS